MSASFSDLLFQQKEPKWEIIINSISVHHNNYLLYAFYLQSYCRGKTHPVLDPDL